VIPIANMIVRSGYEHAFFFFGILQGVCILGLAMLLKKPDARQTRAPSKKFLVTKVDYTPGQMIKTPLFWVIYISFVAVAAGGLIGPSPPPPPPATRATGMMRSPSRS